MSRMLLIGLLAVGSCLAQMKVVGVTRPKNYFPALPASSSSNAHAQGYNGIDYHGGPVMNDPHGTNVYLIWYGNWANSPVPAIVTDFVKNIGGTAYFNMNSSYYDFNPGGEKDPVVNRVSYGGSFFDSYSLGSTLTDDDVANIIGNAIFSGKLPNDPINGVYLVLASADVTETSGFCTAYCAFHGYVIDPSNPNSEKFPGAFIGNPDQCPAFCAEQPKPPTPNNSVAADGIVNLIAHELSETVTDPFGTAWWQTSSGNENGDLCQFTFGNTKFLRNGSFYNVKFGGRPWLIQQIWVNARGGYCGLALDE